MVLYNGSCIVHEEFKVQVLDDLMLEHPDAVVLVHPESPAEIINRADAVGSTSQLIAASQKLNNTKFIVATDILVYSYKMKQLSPHKEFIPAPTAGRWCQLVNHVRNVHG